MLIQLLYMGQIELFGCEVDETSPSLLAIAGDVVLPGCLGEAEALDLLGPMTLYPDLLGGV